MKFETVIGLEIHVELDTQSKIFCSCATTFGNEANENTCPICTGLPGTLPVLNESVVDLAIKAGKALNCSINLKNKFDRKNYFYPDLPKAFQISQFDLPICEGGYIDIGSKETADEKRIGITRIHLEEDAGKLVHDPYDPISLIDYNRTGVPLIEIVSEPDMRSPEEAIQFLKVLKGILEYSKVSDCKMEQGSLRCDANISIRPMGQEALNTKVEIKNMNSFKEIYKALLKEEERQKELYTYNEGHKIVQETRKWDSSKGRTLSMRSKEDAHDYRYFPEPDLSIVEIEEEKVALIKETLPELPQAKGKRFSEVYNLSKKDIEILIEDLMLADYFEGLVELAVDPVTASKWIIVEVLRILKEGDFDEIPIAKEDLAEIIQQVDDGHISRTAAREVFDGVIEENKPPLEIINERSLQQISSDTILQDIIKHIIENNSSVVDDYKSGNDRAIDYLVGQVMKETKGQANPLKTKNMLLGKIQ